MSSPKSTTIPVRLTEEQITALDAIADDQCNTRSGIMRLAVDLLIKSVPSGLAPSVEAGAGQEAA